MRFILVILGLTATVLVAWTVRATEPPKEPVLADFFPRAMAKGEIEEWQQSAAKDQRSLVRFSRIEYCGDAFWVLQWLSLGGQSYTDVAVYAPKKDGAYTRCLLAHSVGAGDMVAAADAKTGILQLREMANSEIKGQVVLSCNLKAIGSAFSTGADRQ